MYVNTSTMETEMPVIIGPMEMIAEGLNLCGNYTRKEFNQLQ